MLTDDTPRVEPAVLTSWKEIAQYLGKGVRTVQRWEQRFGLPVRRPLGAGHKSTVLARREDLDHWMNSAWGRRAKADDLAADIRSNPVHQLLGSNIEAARSLQTTNAALLREISQTLSSIVANCRELRKTRREAEEMISRAIQDRPAVRSEAS